MPNVVLAIGFVALAPDHGYLSHAAPATPLVWAAVEGVPVAPVAVHWFPVAVASRFTATQTVPAEMGFSRPIVQGDLYSPALSVAVTETAVMQEVTADVQAEAVLKAKLPADRLVQLSAYALAALERQLPLS